MSERKVVRCDLCGAEAHEPIVESWWVLALHPRKEGYVGADVCINCVRGPLLAEVMKLWHPDIVRRWKRDARYAERLAQHFGEATHRFEACYGALGRFVERATDKSILMKDALESIDAILEAEGL